MSEEDKMFTTDWQHNVKELEKLVYDNSPPALQEYWKNGYPDDDYPGHTDRIIQFADAITREVRKQS